uniref:XRE family transcriptional regulator n=1 Tax=Leptospirillum ferriphilum TaxID=178606 RepID=A0A7C3LTV9_9BACT
MHPEGVKKIRLALVRKGWNQADLACRLGITPAYFSQIMNGRRTGVRVRRRIPLILGISARHIEDE